MQIKAPGFAGIVGTTSLAFVLVQLDVTIVNVALPAIGAQLHASVSALQWVVDAYTLAFSVLMLTAGSLGDRYGSRRLFLSGVGVFAAGSLACALAPSGTALIAARALQGVGAAAMLPNSLALLNHAYAQDADTRARAVGWWTAAGSIAIAAGPVAGGLLLDTGSWRAIFFVNLPLCAGAMLLALRLPETDRAGSRGPFDMTGQVTATLALTALTASVIELRTLGLAHPLIWSGLLAAVLMTGAFVWTESRAAAPIVPLQLFSKPAFRGPVIFGAIVNLTYYGTVFVLTLYLQHVRGYTPMQAGLAFLPLTAGFFIANVASGKITAAFGARWPMLAGALIDMGGFLLLQRAGLHTPYSELWLPFLLIPTGMGLAVPAMTSVILSSVDKCRAGTASAILNTARQAAGAIGVAAYGALAHGSAVDVTRGLHIAAVSSALLLLAGALLAYRQPAGTGRKSANTTTDRDLADT
jgi:DHA2 family methylenomycin A resistance protein-like MFS transporter